MTKTTAKPIGFNTGYMAIRRQAGRDAAGVLPKPGDRFATPSQRRCNRTAGTRAVARQNRTTQFDEEIIARWPRLWQRIAVCALLALAMSGVLPMAVATFQIWIGDVCGLGATALCFAADAAVIAWLVKRHA